MERMVKHLLLRLNRPGICFKTTPDPDEELIEETPPRRNSAVTVAKFQGNTEAMAAHIGELESDTFKLRQKIRDLKAAAPVIPDGHTTIPEKDLTDLSAYRTLGSVDELKKIVTERDSLISTSRETARQLVLRQVSELHKFDADVLVELDSKHSDAVYELKTSADGTQGFVVKFMDGTVQKEEPVLDFYTTRHPKFVSVLSPNGGSTETNGTPFPKQTVSGPPPRTESPAIGLLAQRYGHAAPQQRA